MTMFFFASSKFQIKISLQSYIQITSRFHDCVPRIYIFEIRYHVHWFLRVFFYATCTYKNKELALHAIIYLYFPWGSVLLQHSATCTSRIAQSILPAQHIMYYPMQPNLPFQYNMYFPCDITCTFCRLSSTRDTQYTACTGGTEIQ